MIVVSSLLSLIYFPIKGRKNNPQIPPFMSSMSCCGESEMHVQTIDGSIIHTRLVCRFLSAVNKKKTVQSADNPGVLVSAHLTQLQSH